MAALPAALPMSTAATTANNDDHDSHDNHNNQGHGTRATDHRPRGSACDHAHEFDCDYDSISRKFDRKNVGERKGRTAHADRKQEPRRVFRERRCGQAWQTIPTTNTDATNFRRYCRRDGGQDDCGHGRRRSGDQAFQELVQETKSRLSIPQDLQESSKSPSKESSGRGLPSFHECRPSLSKSACLYLVCNLFNNPWITLILASPMAEDIHPFDAHARFLLALRPERAEKMVTKRQTWDQKNNPKKSTPASRFTKRDDRDGQRGQHDQQNGDNKTNDKKTTSEKTTTGFLVGCQVWLPSSRVGRWCQPYSRVVCRLLVSGPREKKDPFEVTVGEDDRESGIWGGRERGVRTRSTEEPKRNKNTFSSGCTTSSCVVSSHCLFCVVLVWRSLACGCGRTGVRGRVEEGVEKELEGREESRRWAKDGKEGVSKSAGKDVNKKAKSGQDPAKTV